MSDIASQVLRDAVDIWGDYKPTRLIELPALARRANVGSVLVKVESERPLGNFKVLGGMVAGLRALARAEGMARIRDLKASGSRRRSLPWLICASDGNHGLAVTAAAQWAGTRASVYLPLNVSRVRADRIEALGGRITWIAGTYDDAVREAADAAASGAGVLIPDTSSDPNDAVVRDVMDGYSLLTRELVAQFGENIARRPTHLFAQAGVGGLAAALALGLRYLMRDPKRVLVVEPESAACVARALAVGRPVRITDSLHTSAEMLSCGLASAPAVEVLQQHDARSVVVRESQLLTAATEMRESGGPDTTPSGAAGLAGLMHVAGRHDLRAAHQLRSDSVVLLIATEGPLTAASMSRDLAAVQGGDHLRHIQDLKPESARASVELENRLVP